MPEISNVERIYSVTVCIPTLNILLCYNSLLG